MKPVVGVRPSDTRKPVVGNVKPARRFVFSFRFYKQTPYFGIGGKDSGWFAAVFEKLSEIANHDYESLSTDLRAKKIWRFHVINFSADGVETPRASFDWILPRYLGNSEEFPFFQFQITKAHGRVVGFWDETGVFNIVVLDPMHNMQPCDYSDYKTRDTVIAQSSYACAIDTIEKAISECNVTCECRSLYQAIQTNLTAGLPQPAMIASMSQSVLDRSTKCMNEGLARKLEDILDAGLSSLGY